MESADWTNVRVRPDTVPTLEAHDGRCQCGEVRFRFTSELSTPLPEARSRGQEMCPVFVRLSGYGPWWLWHCGLMP